MAEGIRLTMDIGNKMLRPLRQVQNRLQVDNLRCCAVDIFILIGQQFQIFHFFCGKAPTSTIHNLHLYSSFLCAAL